MEADILQSKRDLYLVQKYGGRYFAKVKGIYVLSRSMEADILKSCPEVNLRLMEADMFNERIGAYGCIL